MGREEMTKDKEKGLAWEEGEIFCAIEEEEMRIRAGERRKGKGEKEMVKAGGRTEK